MIYRPIKTRKMWDTWLFPWDGRYHLFYLETQETHNDHIGHAVSDDLIHWKTRESIKTRGEEGQWNHKRTATGMVVRHDNKFLMFVGGYDPAVTNGDSQVIGIYISEDLENWAEYPDNPVIYPASPYLVKPSDGLFNTTDWRDSYVIWQERDEHYHAYICARVGEVSHANLGSAVAHIRSKDLVKWEYLPPAAVLKEYPNMEVPEVFELSGKYYLTFSSNSLVGIRLNTPSRKDARGTFYMVGSSFDGPFELPKDPLLIGAANRELGAYVGRSIEYKNQRLLYHQMGDYDLVRTSFGPVKLLNADTEGNLTLEYFPGMEKLETTTILDSFAKVVEPKIVDLGVWEKSDSFLDGRDDSSGSLYKFHEKLSDFHFQCDVLSKTAGCAGVIIRDSEKREGVAIILDFENQRLQIGPSMVPPAYNSALALFGVTLKIHDYMEFPLKKNQKYHLRCFARDTFFEVYLDDKWVFSTCLPDCQKVGNAGFYIERGKAQFSNLRLAAIEPLE